MKKQLKITFVDIVDKIDLKTYLITRALLEKYDLKIDLFDPVASDSDVYSTHLVRLKKQFIKDKYSVIILAVPHQEYLNLNIKKSSDNIFIDVRGVYKKEDSDYRL